MIRRPARSLGFSLVELMITVVIAAILAAIAYPAYTQYVQKARRTDAKTALLDLAARQERFFSTQNLYSGTPAELGYAGASFPVQIQSSGQIFYALRVVTANSRTTYTATATPLGPQATDGCGTYVIDQLGRQSNTGLASGVTSASCW